ncbi:MAG: hypothetical protein Q9160_007737 [Pyrenula sp. 1 TL-2023]
MDTGGLAQMSYNSHFNGLGAPSSGFGSRGKGSHIKRLSVAVPPKISTIDESQPINVGNTPRTSRRDLLAGLRTAPKSATLPPSNANTGFYNNASNNQQADRTPQTATAAFFPGNVQNSYNSGRQMYSLPEHVLAPPKIEIDEAAADGDQEYYRKLMHANTLLVQQQQLLQQQLVNVTAAQFSGLELNENAGQQFQPPSASNTSLYSQQLQQGLQPVIQPVPNSPGVFSVYSPMTGRHEYVIDNSAQQPESPPQAYGVQHKSPSPPTPSFRAQVSPPPESYGSPLNGARSRSPPKSTPSPPQDVEPLPPPSANAFRRGHKKSLSSVTAFRTNSEVKSNGPKSAGFAQTPLTGTFGPGQAREGKHPERQPKGPPPLDEILSKPTTKYEGSKNFATRQRRSAVHNLVRAGLERRTETRTQGSGSATPGSDGEFNFSVSSTENEDNMPSSASLSSKPSIGSLRAVASGAIGSERKEKSRERPSTDNTVEFALRSVNSDEGMTEGKWAEVESTRRQTPMFFLSRAEKRKSALV